MNAPRFDRWLPRAAAVREVGERGMMSLTGGEKKKALELLEVVTGQKSGSEGGDDWEFIVSSIRIVYLRKGHNVLLVLK